MATPVNTDMSAGMDNIEAIVPQNDQQAKHLQSILELMQAMQAKLDASDAERSRLQQELGRKQTQPEQASPVRICFALELLLAIISYY